MRSIKNKRGPLGCIGNFLHNFRIPMFSLMLFIYCGIVAVIAFWRGNDFNGRGSDLAEVTWTIVLAPYKGEQMISNHFPVEDKYIWTHFMRTDSIDILENLRCSSRCFKESANRIAILWFAKDSGPFMRWVYSTLIIGAFAGILAGMIVWVLNVFMTFSKRKYPVSKCMFPPLAFAVLTFALGHLNLPPKCGMIAGVALICGLVSTIVWFIRGSSRIFLDLFFYLITYVVLGEFFILLLELFPILWVAIWIPLVIALLMIVRWVVGFLFRFLRIPVFSMVLFFYCGIVAAIAFWRGDDFQTSGTSQTNIAFNIVLAPYKGEKASSNSISATSAYVSTQYQFDKGDNLLENLRCSSRCFREWAKNITTIWFARDTGSLMKWFYSSLIIGAFAGILAGVIVWVLNVFMIFSKRKYPVSKCMLPPLAFAVLTFVLGYLNLTPKSEMIAGIVLAIGLVLTVAWFIRGSSRIFLDLLFYLITYGALVEFFILLYPMFWDSLLATLIVGAIIKLFTSEPTGMYSPSTFVFSMPSLESLTSYFPSSSSSTTSDDSTQSSIVTTYRDNHGYEYVGQGNDPKEITKQCAGPQSTYTKGLDGNWHENWGHEVIEDKDWRDP